MSSSHPLPSWCHWFSVLASVLDVRSAPRLAWVLVGALLARGRRTVTNWIRAAGLSAEYRPCYTAVAAVGTRADLMAVDLVRAVVRPLMAGAERVTLARDDTPTERYGAKVHGAGVHHNPAPGPAGGAFLYGHVWVVLGLLARHPTWGTLALPLLARLYVRNKDLPRIPAAQRPAFRTELALAVELVRWARRWLGTWGSSMWVVTDGAYANGSFVKPLRAWGVTVVSRLRRDAALCTVPGPRAPHRRGPNRTYGARRIQLAKRAGQKSGWSTGTFELYGQAVEKRYKTFVATWRPAGSAIRVVLVDEPHGWVAFFCINPDATVADILTSVAARFALEIAFRDLKDVVGAGHPQVRLVRANVGAFHVCLWALTMTEAWAWNQDPGELVGHRSASPWEHPERRPSGSTVLCCGVIMLRF